MVTIDSGTIRHWAIVGIFSYSSHNSLNWSVGHKRSIANWSATFSLYSVHAKIPVEAQISQST